MVSSSRYESKQYIRNTGSACVVERSNQGFQFLPSELLIVSVSHAPDSFGKESGNFNRVSSCRMKNAI